MILVDSSVWVDYFRKHKTAQVERLDSLLDKEALAIGDLVLVEVLQGFDSELDFGRALTLLSMLDLIVVGGETVAIESARNYRYLRAKGITIRKTIDTLIATRCIMDGHALLFSDRDFDPFVEHLGLVSGMG